MAVELPRLGLGGRIGHVASAEVPGKRIEQPMHSRAEVVQALSRRLVQESRNIYDQYSADTADAEVSLSRHVQMVEDAKAERREKARAKKLKIKRGSRPSNPFENHPQPYWVDAGSTALPPIPPMSTLKRTPWVRTPRDEDESSPISQLKKLLAGNMTRVSALLLAEAEKLVFLPACPPDDRMPACPPAACAQVVELFRKWDVNCDGNVNINELRDAIGALGLHHQVMSPRGVCLWDESTMDALFRALDLNNSGAVDFHELHHALRKYNPPPLPTKGGDLPAISLEMPRRKSMTDTSTTGSGKDLEAIASIKRTLALNQSRVIDLFKRWDYDMDTEISAHELRRALAALSISIDARALKLLFRTIDTDGSGNISFNELNAVLRRQVDFDSGNGERFDATTGTYTTGHTAVKEVAREVGAKNKANQQQQQQQQGAPSVPTLPPIGLSMTAHVENLSPTVVVADDHAALARRRKKHSGKAVERELSDTRAGEAIKSQAAQSKVRQGVDE